MQGWVWCVRAVGVVIEMLADVSGLCEPVSRKHLLRRGHQMEHTCSHL